MQNKMAYTRINNVIRKEWETTFYNLNSALFITLLPFIITLQALILIYLVIKFSSSDALVNTILQRGVDTLQGTMPSLLTLSPLEKFQVLFYSQFPFYLLLIPVMIAISFATFSIIEEKQARALEPLLATPVRTWELLLGKALAGAIPSIIITWICAGIFLAGVKWIGTSHLLKYVITSSWWISILFFVPLITVFGFMLGIIASSRTNDPKNAQNLAIVIILPVLGLIGIQLVGYVILTPGLLVIMAGVLFILDLLILKVAVRLFKRESIVIKWK